MSPMRTTRSFMAGALSLSLLATLLAVPGVVLAGVPNWVILEEGNTTNPGAVELPPRVAPTENAGYSVTIKNNGPSNISQLYFYAEGAPNPVYSQPSQGTCGNPNGTLFCSLGSLAAGGTATIVAAFPTPAEGSSFSVDFFFNTTGLGSGGGDNSHGDELAVRGTTAIIDDPNFGGGFSTDLGDSALTDAMSASNKVSTKLTAPATANNLVLTVADQSAVLNDPACADCAPLPTSELHLGDGTAQYGISTAVIEYHKDLVRLVNFKRLTVVHFHDDGSSHEIAFQRSCSGTTECAMFQSLSGGHVRVTLYLAQNGWVKYH